MKLSAWALVGDSGNHKDSHPASTPMDVLINLANILYVIAHFTLDMLRLRLLTTAGALCLALSFYSQPVPMLNIVAWNLFFVGLNLTQIARLLIARHRPQGHRTARATIGRRSARVACQAQSGSSPTLPRDGGPTVADRADFAAYCQAWKRFWKTDAAQRRRGSAPCGGLLR